MRSSKSPLLVLVASLVWLTGCSLVESNYVSTPGVDVSQYETYSWVTEPLAAEDSGIYRFDNSMRNALSAELAVKGYRWVESGGDMLLDFRLGLRPEEVERGSSVPPQGVEFDRSGNTNVDLNPTMDVSAEVVNYTRGEIVVTFYSPDQQQRYWEGSVSQVTEQQAGDSVEVREENIPGYVSRILNKFPKR
ncbi:hypothetical protein R50073_01910 [Maricurvus nonylphenolicus]|uniref:DUF4136 domain-containing protein n=1 Tax=Maricurvus nonylphenolicus TaxID=1008307 RepID=UPI0036F337E8